MLKAIHQYTWRGDDSKQYRISYIPDRGGVEVVDPNGYTRTEVDVRDYREAKKIMAGLVRQIKNNEL